MQKKWLIKEPPDLQQVEALKRELNLSEVVASLLVQRGILQKDKIQSFFRGNINRTLDPFLMKNMHRAVERINEALQKGEKILIYGDYDVDGTTSVALVYGFLSSYTSTIDYYIPDRYKEGYGVSETGIEYAKENGFSLLITLDCGIKAVQKAALAKKYAIDMIICDHHNPGRELPEAIILDPKQKDCAYPYKELCGCGVGFKLMEALCSKNKWAKNNLLEQLDLLAISIGADIVPVTGENRLLARHGLKNINQNKSPRLGIDFLLKLAKKERPLTLTDIVFIIAPRINAAGRMDDAKKVVELLTSSEEEKIRSIAMDIHQLNEERRDTDKTITEEALLQVRESPGYKNKCTTVVYHQDWHKGVIGIVASRLIEHFYRPTIVLTQSKDKKTWTGSARSIANINIYAILDRCKDSILQFGGHYFAAGLTVADDQMASFQKKFEEEVRKVIEPETLIPELIIDREISFNELFNEGESVAEVPRLMRVLQQFEPFGPHNKKPLFLAKNVFAQRPQLLKGEHLKMEVFQSDFKKPIDAIYFKAPEALEIVENGSFDLLFTLDINEFRGRSTPQLMIKDLRRSPL